MDPNVLRQLMALQQSQATDDPMDLLRRQIAMRGQAAQNPQPQQSAGPRSSMLAQAMQRNDRPRGLLPDQNPGAPSDKLAMRQNSPSY